MKNLLLLATLLIVMAGCKFESALTPKPTREIDPAMLGSWFSLEDGRPLDIYRLSATEYMVNDDGQPYVCTHSDLAGTSFISCRQIKNDKEAYDKYAYIAYNLDGNILSVMALNESLKLKDAPVGDENRVLLEQAVKSGIALDTDPKHVIRYQRKGRD